MALQSMGLGCRSWGLAALVALGALLSLADATQAAGAAPASDSAAKRQRPIKRVLVWANTGGGSRLGRPQGALVKVRWRGRIIGQARTGARGIAVVRLSRRPPRHFSVEVSGGVLRGGHRFRRIEGSLRARVASRKRKSVYVNPATTLAFYYKARHPHLSERRVRNRVRAFLRLPRGHGIEADLRSTPYFDGRRYLQGARRAGGLDRFSRALAGTIGKRRGRGHSFATRRGSRAPGPRRRAATVSATETDSLSSLAALSNSLSSYSGIFGAIGGVSGALGVVNTVMSLAGVTPLDTEVDELGKEMNELLASMHYVEGQLKKIDGEIEDARVESAKNAYANLKADQDGLMGQIDSARVQWEEIANLGSQISCPNGTESCPDAQPVEQICSAEPTRADCEELQTLYTGSAGLLDMLKTHGLTDYSAAHSLARAIGDDGLIKYGSLATAAGGRYYASPENAEAVKAADYYLTQLSLLISLIGAYQTAPDVEAPAANIETGLKGITEVTRSLPALVPGVMPATNVIDTATGLMWQTKISANTVLEGAADPFLPPFYMLGLHSVHGATAWEMARAGTFHYSNGWISHDGSLKVPRTLGEGAPSTLGSRIWKPAPANALEDLLAESSYTALTEAGFASELFTPVVAKFSGLPVYDALFVATLPGNGATSDFADGDTGPLYGGLFNFKDSKPKPDLGLVWIDKLDDTSLNFLMYRTPYSSECWYYAQAGKPASC